MNVARKNMMKRYVCILFVLVATSAASGSRVWIEEYLDYGAHPSDTIPVWIWSDTELIALDAIITVDYGPATIVSVISKADCAGYGWDPGVSFDPAGEPSQSLEIGLGNAMGNTSYIVGYFEIHVDNYASHIAVSLGPGDGFGGSMDINWETPTITGSVWIRICSLEWTFACYND
jgi:hypothetical protein